MSNESEREAADKYSYGRVLRLGKLPIRCEDCRQDRDEDEGRFIIGRFICGWCQEDERARKAARRDTLPLF